MRGEHQWANEIISLMKLHEDDVNLWHLYLRWFFVFFHPNSVVQFADPNTQLSRLEISNVDREIALVKN